MDIYIFSIISAWIGYISSRLANRRLTGALSTIGVCTIIAIAAVGFTWIGHSIINAFQVQRPSDEREGQWVEQYDEEGIRTYGIATISYSPDYDSLKFEGVGYDVNLEELGHWFTIKAWFEHHDEYTYVYKGYSKNTKQEKQGPRYGMGTITFFPNGNNGQGYFVSLGDDPKRRNFSLYKINDPVLAKESLETPKIFLDKFYKNENFRNKIIAIAGN